MIVVMKACCEDKDIEHVLTFLDNHGLSGHLSRGIERTLLEF
jgi:3-deoxy-7-phosphoheptulonate synthase